MASTPFFARLFATLLPHSLAHRNQPFLQAPHNIVGSLPTVRFAAKQRWPSLYIRLLFAHSQDLKAVRAVRRASRATQAARHARHCLGVFSRLLRPERPDLEKKYWKEVLW